MKKKFKSQTYRKRIKFGHRKHTPKQKKGNHSLVYQLNEAILHFAKVQAIKILTALRQ